MFRYGFDEKSEDLDYVFRFLVLMGDEMVTLSGINFDGFYIWWELVVGSW